MAGDWIKMRVSLFTHPKVMRIASMLESHHDVGKRLSTGFNGALQDIVTRDVTRDVTVASLLRVWGAANEHTDDGVWTGICINDLDHVAGIPGFGSMMEAVGWASFDDESRTVTFRNFLEYNAPAKNGRSSNAERQRRYRQRKQKEQAPDCYVTRYVTGDVTGDVTRYGEKRREEKSIKKKTTSSKKFVPPTVAEVASYCQERGNSVDPGKFVDHYEASGWMRGKNKIKDWKACVRTWENKDNERKPKGAAGCQPSLVERERAKLERILGGGGGA